MQSLEAVLSSNKLLVAQQVVRGNKVSTVDPNAQALAFLSSFARDHQPQLPEESLPSKFELVGDVLMIPETAFTADGWLNFVTNIADDNVIAFWTQLAAFFGVSRVARKAIVDSGEMRESKVRLLLPPVGRPNENESTSAVLHGPGSVGWVWVTENGIKYGFDITRVMFCSGNVTERMRMGRVKAADQVIVDLYCGIGYYTVPFLVHAGAKHVYACEWNPNSILALRANLHANKVSPSRYTVFEGDNNLTVHNPENHLVDAADRVCLGLLPSSTKGWPLAVLCLNKVRGGILHVHENVLIAELDSWTANCVATFEKYFVELTNTEMRVTVAHREIVKNYAPRVVHIVLDLLCEPICG